MSLIDELIENYGSDSETFTITLPKGEALTFRFLRDYGEIHRLRVGALELWGNVLRGAVPESWSPYLPSTQESTTLAYLISQTSFEPKISQLEALRLVKELGPVADFLRRKMDEHQFAHLAALEDREVDSAKKGFASTCAADKG